MSGLLSVKRLAFAMGTAVVISSTALTGVVSAIAQTSSSTKSAATQKNISTIITKGNEEINRRLTSLQSLSTIIAATTKLTANDKSYLASEVNAEIVGLTNLKTTLDAETTLQAAETDAQSIYTEYRVYALIVPKVALVKAADDEQVTATELTTLAQKLQTRITTAQTAGKNVTSLQTELSDMTSETNSAENIASLIEQKVVTLQPSDYNSDQAILSGDATQLKTAHSDNQAAFSDAKSIVSALIAL